ncbi:MAG: prephenate dehydrogenase [Oscillospiraceae bacterium]|nr:prephenate dehydrogenase [Oscillospiraceae bacterium]
MTVGILGLGLIGGSFARAYSSQGHTVLAWDTDETILSFARLCGAVSGELNAGTAACCDLILLCVYPGAAIAWLREMGESIGPGPLVVDCCGTKRVIFAEGAALAKRFGFTYLGGHPMAGTQYSGFKHSRANLFQGAPMVLVPVDHDDIVLLSRARELLEPAGFGSFSVTTAEKHDEMIAFTSQLAHVVSSAYIKSPTALSHKGFSAGSYRDMTRVAWLNPEMWSELFLDNRDNLLRELDILSENLDAYRRALRDGDRAQLIRLLQEGKERKEAVDGK